MRGTIVLGLILALFAAVTPAAEAQGRPPVKITVAPVEARTFHDTVEALGTARANETVLVTSTVTDRLVAVHFDDGQTVSGGDVLVELDKAEQEAELRALNARLEERRQAYDRARDLARRKVLSDERLDERRSLLRQIEAEIDALSSRIADRTIRAPFDGVLGLREISVGALIEPGDPIVTVDDLSVVKVDFQVPAPFLGMLRPGLRALARTDAHPDRTFDGMVRSVAPRIDPVTRTVTIRAVVPNDEALLRPGLLMTMTLLANPRQAPAVPEETLIFRDDAKFVFVVDETGDTPVVRRREVTIGGRVPGWAEIASGLRVGEMVVRHGTLKVRDGAKVEIVREIAARPPAEQELQP